MFCEVQKHYQIKICHIYNFFFFPNACLTTWKGKHLVHKFTLFGFVFYSFLYSQSLFLVFFWE